MHDPIFLTEVTWLTFLVVGDGASSVAQALLFRRQKWFEAILVVKGKGSHI